MLNIYLSRNETVNSTLNKKYCGVNVFVSSETRFNLNRNTEFSYVYSSQTIQCSAWSISRSHNTVYCKWGNNCGYSDDAPWTLWIGAEHVAWTESSGRRGKREEENEPICNKWFTCLSVSNQSDSIERTLSVNNRFARVLELSLMWVIASRICKCFVIHYMYSPSSSSTHTHTLLFNHLRISNLLFGHSLAALAPFKLYEQVKCIWW